MKPEILYCKVGSRKYVPISEYDSSFVGFPANGFFIVSKNSYRHIMSLDESIPALPYFVYLDIIESIILNRGNISIFDFAGIWDLLSCQYHSGLFDNIDVSYMEPIQQQSKSVTLYEKREKSGRYVEYGQTFTAFTHTGFWLVSNNIENKASFIGVPKEPKIGHLFDVEHSKKSLVDDFSIFVNHYKKTDTSISVNELARLVCLFMATFTA